MKDAVEIKNVSLLERKAALARLPRLVLTDDERAEWEAQEQAAAARGWAKVPNGVRIVHESNRRDHTMRWTSDGRWPTRVRTCRGSRR